MNNKYIIEIVNTIKKNKSKVVIWGAGFLGSQWGYNFLLKHDLEVDFYCDSNEALWGTSINEKKVISIEELAKMKKDVFVFVIMGHYSALEVCRKLEEIGVEQRATYTELLQMGDVRSDYYPYMEKPRVAVYTCITNDYDELMEHEYVSELWDLYMLTDNPDKEYKNYKCLDINDFIPKGLTDPTRQNRYCKLHPHEIFPDYRYSIYFDANTYFVSDFTDVVRRLPKTRMAVASKLFVDDIYEEAMRIMNARRDDPEIIAKQMKEYWTQGMPEHFGQYWNYVLVREHNNPICKRLMDEWWTEYEKYSKRDQMSLPYVIWKNGYSFDDVGIIDGENKFWKRTANHKRGESRV